MKNLNIKHAAISAIVVYIIGILAFVGSFFLPIMNDPELQANLVLVIVLIPAAYLGAHIYYQKNHSTHGFVLGIAMFFSAIILDATITVPLFIIPNGGSHLSFFGDPGFWLIGLEYILVVLAYWKFKVVKTTEVATAL
jgi:hypothetical protein